MKISMLVSSRENLLYIISYIIFPLTVKCSRELKKMLSMRVAE